MVVTSEFPVIILFTNFIPPFWPATNSNLSCARMETLEIMNYYILIFKIVQKTVYAAILTIYGERGIQ